MSMIKLRLYLEIIDRRRLFIDLCHNDKQSRFFFNVKYLISGIDE